MTNVDSLAGVSFLFLLVPVIAYAIVVYFQSRYADATNYRATVLATRAAIFLPGYAILMWISLVAPRSYPALQVLVNLVEGYTFYSFFSLLVHNLGGPAAAVETMTKEGKPYVLTCGACPGVDEKEKFYRRSAWVMFHMLYTRVGLSILAAICDYANAKAGYLIISIINAVIVFTMIIHVVNFYEMTYSHHTNIYGIIKLLLLKMSVGLIVVEGIIASAMISANKQAYNPNDDEYGTDDKTQRGYCALVLIELIVLSIPYLWAYGCLKIKPSTAPHYDGSKDKEGEGASCGAFYCSCWSVWDILCGYLSLSSSKAPLTANQA